MKNKIMLAVLVIVLVAFNYGIYEKEQIKQEGETVFLKTAPFDPRAFMLGDYMNLGYEVENDLRDKWYKEDQKNRVKPRGIVIRVDSNKVGKSIRYYTGEDLAEGEKILKIDSYMRIRPHSYFFQEGKGKYFEIAKYAVFKFKGADNYILVGLADANMKIIKPPVEE